MKNQQFWTNWQRIQNVKKHVGEFNFYRENYKFILTDNQTYISLIICFSEVPLPPILMRTTQNYDFFDVTPYCDANMNL